MLSVLFHSVINPVKNFMTNYFGSIFDFYQLCKNNNLSFSENSTIELMCHPGHEDNKLFMHEISILESDFFSKLQNKIKLISYHDLL